MPSKSKETKTDIQAFANLNDSFQVNMYNRSDNRGKYRYHYFQNLHFIILTVTHINTYTQYTVDVDSLLICRA